MFITTRNDALSGNAVATIVNHHCAERVQPFDVDSTVRLDSLQVVVWRNERGGVTTELLIVVANIKPETVESIA